MTLEILKTKSQIDQSRQTMKARDISFSESRLAALARKFRLNSSLSIGDYMKSWDVLRSIEFIEHSHAKKDAILDIGCFCSEIILCLHKLGYTNLFGVDLDPDVSRMPHADQINFSVQNFLTTDFDAESFDAITSISVMEHGFQADTYLGEMTRILKPGGHLVTSFDYWESKIDTGETRFFDMDWLIFSKEEIISFIELAQSYGLVPVGSIDPSGKDKTVHCAGYDYTFGLLILKKQ